MLMFGFDMKLYLITGCIFLFLLISILLIVKKSKVKVLYEIYAIMVNVQKEVLLIYDRKNKRLNVPHIMVPFDEIPTRIVPEYLKEVTHLELGDYSYNMQIHEKTQKFDRVRDDIGPILIKDEIKKRSKKSCLFYSFAIDESIREVHKEKYPYPDFFSVEEIKSMDKSTRPPEEVCEVLYKLSDML